MLPTLDLSELFRPIIAEAVAQALYQQRADAEREARQEVFTEGEGAEFLRLNRWQLRDLRLAGKIAHSTVVGRRVRYRRSDLESYLTKTRVEATS